MSLCIVLLMSSVLCGVDDDSFAPTYSPGSKCRLGTKDIKYVLVADGYIWSRRLDELVAASDQIGVQEMVDKKRAFLLEPQTSAQVIKRTGNWIEVRVLSGAKTGAAVYVHQSYLNPPPTKKEIAEEEMQKADDEKAKLDAEKTRIAKLEEMRTMASKEARERQRAAKEAKVDQKNADAKKLFEKTDATQREAEKKSVEEDKAADLLLHARRWLKEGNKDIATERLDELLRRFPKSKVADEAKKLRSEIK